MARPQGRVGRRPAVTLEEGAEPGAARCPACDEPLFAWIETDGWGMREDQVIDRCENCGLVAARGSVPSSDAAAAELFGPGRRGANGNGGAPPESTEIVVRASNADSIQAWLGAENWSALHPGDPVQLKVSPRAAELLAAKSGLEVVRVRYLAQAGIASMWQTLLNLLTFHRDFAAEAFSGRLRPKGGKGRAAYAVDMAITVLIAIPTAMVATLIEGGALLARRGGTIEVSARPKG
jgi:hypothetical protein